MLTHKIRDMPPGFDKGPGVPTAPSSEDGREPSPDRRSSPDKMELKRSPPAHPPPMTHASPIDMPSLPKRPSGKRSFRYQRDMVLSRALCYRGRKIDRDTAITHGNAAASGCVTVMQINED